MGIQDRDWYREKKIDHENGGFIKSIRSRNKSSSADFLIKALIIVLIVSIVLIILQVA